MTAIPTSKPTLTVNGAWTTITGMTTLQRADIMLECCSALHPDRKAMQAFKDKRWDGRVHLYDGNRFPTGLIASVSKVLSREGVDFDVKDAIVEEPLDTSRFGPDFLPETGKFKVMWDHQYAATMALLNNDRGIIKIPTGGGKSEVALAVAWYLWQEKGWRTLIITSKKGLAKQTTMRFRSYVRGELRIGQCGDGLRETGDCHIVVATAATMAYCKDRRMKRAVPGSKLKRFVTVEADEQLQDVVKTFEVLILDEVHHGSSDEWFDIAMLSGAKRRYGMSGTPLKDKELDDLRVMAATGNLIYTVETQVLVEANLSARPRIAMVMSENVSGPDLPRTEIFSERLGKMIRLNMPYQEAYLRGVVANEKHNLAVYHAAEWCAEKHNRITLILCRRDIQFQQIAEYLEESGISYFAAKGATQLADRDQIKRAMATRRVKVVLATTIWDEGEDLDNVEAIVLAEGVKANTNVLQRIGRGMRRGGREVWIVDFVPTNHPTLGAHAYARAKHYEGEGHEVLFVGEWPKLDFGSPLPDDLLPFAA
jgi:superfamily II DNA or RNA helicase